ncbi:cell division protein FtsZ [SAR202 cluster bacterium AD-804-J14_MRT_500m]|nr:cell division protein FtsZ [SAR202 cluster bacterium AD-804-J14_MRT_500m]
MLPRDQEPFDPLTSGSIPQNDLKPYGNPVIKVIGVGGGGSNAVSRMFKEKIPGVEYYAVNTDAQHLARSEVSNRLTIGQSLTRGLGAGGNPDIGRQAAEESIEQIEQMVGGADMVFLAAGMGGGTGTGAIPIIAQTAKDAGALTVAVVSKPFSFEVATRRKNTEEGLSRIIDHVDTLITIPNDRLLQLEHAQEHSKSWDDALRLADSVLHQGIQAVAEVVTVPGEINVDFADVKAIMHNAGPAWLAIGKGKGENRAIDAAKMATRSPLLDISVDGAKRILFVMTGGPSLSLVELQQASEVMHELADPDANLIFGTVKDPKMDDEVKVTLIAASFPLAQENLIQRQDELRRLLRDTVSHTDNGDELDVPSFLRKEALSRTGGYFG